MTYKTISEVSEYLDLPPHVLRFWEGQFVQIKPLKRRGNRRYYSEKDIEILEKIKNLLYVKGYTIKGAKKALNQHFLPQFILTEDFDDMKRKQAKPDTRQIDIFEMIGGQPSSVTPPTSVNENIIPQTKHEPSKAKKTGAAEKEALQNLLSSLKEMEKLLREAS